MHGILVIIHNLTTVAQFVTLWVRCIALVAVVLRYVAERTTQLKSVLYRRNMTWGFVTCGPNEALVVSGSCCE